MRQLDGGGLWLGTDSMTRRLVQYGTDPSLDATIVQTLTSTQIEAIPQFDTNFTLSGESRYPVLVEYPSHWIGLHGILHDQTQSSPFTSIGERPCVLWQS